MDYLLAFGHAIVQNAPYLVGFVMPPFVEIVNKDVKTEEERYIVAVLVCGFAAVVLHWHQIAYGSPEQVVAYAGIIFLESNTLFKLYFANSWFRGKIQSLVGNTGSGEPVQEEGSEAVNTSI